NLSYYYEWYLGGSPYSGGISGDYPSGAKSNVSSIPTPALAGGQQWTLSCMATNGTANGTWLNSSATYIFDKVYVSNSSISPSPNASVFDTLSGYCAGGEFNGSNVSFSYSWYVNGSLNSSGSGAQNYSTGYLANIGNISAAMLSAGQSWVLECAASDGTYNSSPVNSTPTYVINSPPYWNITNSSNISDFARIIPSPAAYVNDTLEGYCNATDPENDSLTYYYSWYLGNSTNSTGTAPGAASGIMFNVGTVPPSLLAVGQDWTFGCVASDGISNSSELNSTPTSIIARPPYFNYTNATNISDFAWIAPSPAAYPNQILQGFCDAVSPDNASISYYYAWYADNVSNSTGFTSGGASGVGLNVGNLSGPFAVGTNWTLGCIATDGIANSTEIASLPTEIISASPYWNYTNTSVLSDFARIIPSPTAYLNNTLEGYCNATNPVNSSMTYYYTWYLNGTANATGSAAGAEAGVMLNIGNVSASELSIGQLWTLGCVASDGSTNSSELNSTPTQVVSYTPYWNYTTLSQAVRVSPAPNAYASDTLLGYCTATDPENDSIIYYYTWYLNNVTNSTGVSAPSPSGIETQAGTVPSSLLAVGQDWSIGCIASDNSTNSTELVSDATRVIASPPSCPPGQVLCSDGACRDSCGGGGGGGGGGGNSNMDAFVNAQCSGTQGTIAMYNSYGAPFSPQMSLAYVNGSDTETISVVPGGVGQYTFTPSKPGPYSLVAKFGGYNTYYKTINIVDCAVPVCKNISEQCNYDYDCCDGVCASNSTCQMPSSNAQNGTINISVTSTCPGFATTISIAPSDSAVSIASASSPDIQLPHDSVTGGALFYPPVSGEYIVNASKPNYSDSSFRFSVSDCGQINCSVPEGLIGNLSFVSSRNGMSLYSYGSNGTMSYYTVSGSLEDLISTMSATCSQCSAIGASCVTDTDCCTGMCYAGQCAKPAGQNTITAKAVLNCEIGSNSLVQVSPPDSAIQIFYKSGSSTLPVAANKSKSGYVFQPIGDGKYYMTIARPGYADALLQFDYQSCPLSNITACRAVNQPCKNDSACCSSYCNLAIGLCDDKVNKCTENGYACAISDQCCFGTCASGKCLGCNTQSNLCRTTADCCSGFCSGNICVLPPGQSSIVATLTTPSAQVELWPVVVAMAAVAGYVSYASIGKLGTTAVFSAPILLAFFVAPVLGVAIALFEAVGLWLKLGNKGGGKK
ncbi:MAG TPA: hypothetical protein PLO51_00005, partial [Candidatus Micrarchaeota archaeon]|nr:hypothetical protein [Candidatus Micrarchaeota archaeon]